MKLFAVLLFATLTMLLGASPRRDASDPHKVLVPPTVVAGQIVEVRVELTAPPTSDTTVQVGGYGWEDLPAQVTFPAGQSVVVFSATVSEDPGDVVSVSASANGVTKWGHSMPIPY
jgi:hypothetical protein